MQRIWISGLALACGLISPALAQDDGQVDAKPLTGTFLHGAADRHPRTRRRRPITSS